MGYTLYIKGSTKRAHPGTPAPTYKTRAEVERWRQYQARGLPANVKKQWLRGTEIRKTPTRRRRAKKTQPSYAWGSSSMKSNGGWGL